MCQGQVVLHRCLVQYIVAGLFSGSLDSRVYGMTSGGGEDTKKKEKYEPSSSNPPATPMQLWTGIKDVAGPAEEHSVILARATCSILHRAALFCFFPSTP